MRIPITLQPVWRFVVHVVLGAFAFLIVFFVAVGVGWWVDWAERHGAHGYVIEYARWAETIILWLDLFSLAVFAGKETIKLCRHYLLRDWDD